jgi:uncharacterized protein (TIGR03790 family)
MNFSIRLYLVLLLSITILAGCSKSGSVVTPPTPDNIESLSTLPDQSGSYGENGFTDRSVIASMLATIDPTTGQISLEPAERVGSYHFNLTSLKPNVIGIAGFGYDPAHNNNFYADIKLTHPYPGSGIDAFDPRIIAVLPANSPSNSLSFPGYNVLLNGKVVMEPDGYMRLWDKTNLPGDTNPFKAYYKNQPYRRFASNVAPETQRWYLNLSGFSGPIQFYLICDVSTGYPLVPTPVTHNAPDPVDVQIGIDGTLAANGGYANVTATILDWQGTSYVTVGIECPALFDGIIPFELQGPGIDPNTYIYTGEIGNDNLAPQGKYYSLVNAFDGYEAVGIYKVVALTVAQAPAPVFFDSFIDYSTIDKKEIRVKGFGFGNNQNDSVILVDGLSTGFTVASWRYDEIRIQIPNDNKDHSVHVQINGAAPYDAPLPESDSILFIYNTLDSDSVAIKDYYTSATTGRGISDEMIYGMNLSLGEAITRTEYNEQIKAPVENFILTHDLKYRIKYIVLAKGIPLKVNATHDGDYYTLDYAAVESEMTLLFNTNPLDGKVNNPFYAKPAGSWFHPFKFSYGTGKMSYLVTRLAAWDLDEVFAEIDRGLYGYSGSEAYAILDGGTSYDRMESAATRYADMGLQYLFENGPIFLTAETIANPAISDHVIAYTGHGIHHNPAPPGGTYYIAELDFTLLNGAIFNTYESFNGTTFIEANRSSHGMVGDWIRVGGTGGIGHVFEPWSDAVGDERYLYPRQVSGHNLAEACYMSCKYLSWTETIVGDPLCVIDVM